jgi:hypothetical protein
VSEPGDVDVALGTAAAEAVAYDMNDEEVLEYQRQARERARRRVPMGFRADCSTAYWLGGRKPGSFPEVPHFDV